MLVGLWQPAIRTATSTASTGRHRISKPSLTMQARWRKSVDGLRRLYVDAALEFLTLPAARPRVVGIGWHGRTGLATDARVADVIERQKRDPVRLGVLPHVLRRPRGQNVDLG